MGHSRSSRPRSNGACCLIIDNCAHPYFRDPLHRYLKMVRGGHTPQRLSAAFAFHCEYLKSGDMRKLDWKTEMPELAETRDAK